MARNNIYRFYGPGDGDRKSVGAFRLGAICVLAGWAWPGCEVGVEVATHPEPGDLSVWLVVSRGRFGEMVLLSETVCSKHPTSKGQRG